MPAASRKLTREDLLPDSVYAERRKQRRADLLPSKRLRRVAVGPWCTFYFESFETMLFQVQEMLLTEKGGAAQVEDELTAYNPLIPQGKELVATVMFEIDEPVRRSAILRSLGGVESHFFFTIDGVRSAGTPEGDEARTRDGKTSSVHFLRFALSSAQAAALKNGSTPAMVGCDHPEYGHLAVLSKETQAELAKDLS